MLTRDFSNETFFNLIFRFSRAILGRFRGLILSKLVFFTSTPKNLYFGTFPRIMNSRSIKLGNNIKFGIFSRIECYSAINNNKSSLHIGNGSSFGDYIHIGCANKIIIGNFVLGGSHILITDHSHGIPKQDMLDKNNTPPIQREISSKGSIIIGNNVWLSDGVTILAGADIGEGAIIAANTIVKSKVPPFTIFGNQ